MRPTSLRVSGCERVCSARLLACPPATLAAVAFADAWPNCASGKAATAATTAAPAIQTRFIMTPFPVVFPLEQGEPASWERTGGSHRLAAELTPFRSGESDQVCRFSGE